MESHNGTVGSEPEETDVLVVDDEPSVRGFIARVLLKNGYSCRTASDAQEALREAISRPPLLTVSDVRMPGQQGTWLLTELKQRWPDMGVIMLTAVTDAKTAVRCLKDGADDYLVKPIDLDELLIAVKRATERVRLVREAKANRHNMAVVQNRSEQLRDALQVIESTYQEAIGALMSPAPPAPPRDSSTPAPGDETEIPGADPSAELSALRVAGKLIGDGTPYLDVAAGVANDLVANGGLVCTRLWTTRDLDTVESIVSVGQYAPSALAHVHTALSEGAMQIEQCEDTTWITCPIHLKGVPTDVLQLGWREGSTAQMKTLAERLSLVLAVALAREHDARERHRTSEELDLFYKLAAASRHALELEHVAEFLMSSIHKVVDYDVAGLLLLNDDSSLKIQTRFAPSQDCTERVKSHIVTNLKLTCGVAPPAALRVTESEVTHDGVARSEPQKLRSCVNVPLTVGGSVVGLIHVSSGRDHAFTEREVLFVNRAANFLASSVQGIGELVAAVKSRVERMVDHMSDGVLMLDPRGRVVAMNGAARQLLDCEAGAEASVDAGRLTEILDFDPLEALAAERRSLKRVICLRGVAYQAQLSPITAEEGSLTGAVVAFRNFEEETRVDEMKSELVNVVSHELRTPLTAINNAVGLLRSTRLGALSEQQNHFLDLTQRNVDQLISIINDLLDLSKIEAGKMRIDLQPMSLAVPVEAAVSSLKPQAESKGVSLDFDVAPNVPDVHGNVASIQRVLVNLLGNAIKFSAQGGGVSVDVRMSEEVDGGHSRPAVVVSVTDSGIGVPEDQLESIFDKFHQVMGENKLTTTMGTGLGLPICRELVKAHHGDIWAERVPSGGSRFSFAIPVLSDEELFYRILSEEIVKTRQQNAPLSLALIELGNADELRERLGPERLETLLKELHEGALQVVRRASDQVLMLHDATQVAIILPQTPLDGSRAFGSRLRETMQDSSLPTAGAELCVSCALVDDDDVSAEQLYASARERVGETTLA